LRVVAKLIGLSVPFLNMFRNPEPWPYDLDELQHFEEGSLGRELHFFLTSRNLGYLPKYEVHDTYHALLGYGTTVTEELKLQSFMWGNRNSTFAGKVLFVLGYIVFPSKHEVFREEIERGRKAKQLSKVDLASIVPVQLDKIRKDLCIN
ncbi:MAG: Coq4 family protein, partial [Pseudomonadota bacterium]|nr:Coq4 family protein [Pseudomonadota bacterium]